MGLSLACRQEAIEIATPLPTLRPTFTTTIPVVLPPAQATAIPLGPPIPTATPVIGAEGYVPRPVPEQDYNLPQIASLWDLVPADSSVNTSSWRLAAPQGSVAGSERLVLSHYFAWFSGVGWDDCNMSQGDKPVVAYDSADPTTIKRHIDMAQRVGIDGFTLHWFFPGDATDRNFATLLEQARGTNFQATIVYSRHIYHGASAGRGDIVTALRHIIDQHSQHPNFLKSNGKPVLFFTDMYRVPAASGETLAQFWDGVRDEVDPQRRMIWIAEGLVTSYLSSFDGLYIFKLTHANSPNDYQKAPVWAERVRTWPTQPKLWVASIGPGWDDTRAGCKPDVRDPAPLHRNDREDGAFYQRTFNAAMASDPDWLMVASFNEWVEGSYIEPSVLYGDKYYWLTGAYVRAFKSR